MRERFARFMAGRNGNDQLNTFLLAVTVVLLVLGSIFTKKLGAVLYPLMLVLLGYVYFRMFSRNVYRRQEENEKYLRWRMRAAASLRLRKERWQQRKDYKFFTCPSCKTVLRVPKGKGKIKLVCRKCGTSFIGRS
ncbi:MAG: hypothetical protein IJ594_10085 [Oscillospiraceae bacterium]|nr:hypothetical protein [Oscillospiraceae bacterium]